MSQNLIERARKGDLEALLALGENYERGLGVNRDLSLAFDWYKKAAAAGSAHAMHRLADNCHSGYFPGGESAAEDWRKKADAVGQTNLASVLRSIEKEKIIPAYRDPKRKAAPKNAAFKGGAGKKILVVDDEAPIREILQLYLEQLGFKPILADSVKTALAKMSANPDIRGILLDYNMPQVNGLQLLAMARKMKLMEGIPYIMVTATTDKKLVSNARTLGVAGWIVKPFNKEKIQATLNSLVA